MDIIYDRQKDLGLRIPDSVLIIGCGGLGFWVASGLVACGVPSITLLDGDTVDITNLNRTLYPMSSVGRFKPDALKDILLGMRPDIKVAAAPVMCQVDDIGVLCDVERMVVVDCTDDYEFQKAAYKLSKTEGWRYVRVGCKVNHITVTSTVPDWTVGNKERVQCGVHIASWVVPVMKAAQYAIDKIIRNPDLEVSEEV